MHRVGVAVLAVFAVVGEARAWPSLWFRADPTPDTIAAVSGDPTDRGGGAHAGLAPGTVIGRYEIGALFPDYREMLVQAGQREHAGQRAGEMSAKKRADRWEKP